jgi:hypothetical protein
MTEVPKIVVNRLREATSVSSDVKAAHPEADLLAALIEQKLRPAEREGVLAHLASCSDCREILAFSQADEPAVPVEVEERAGSVPASTVKPATSWNRLFAWPGMHWATVAACAVVVVAVMLLRPDKKLVTPASVPPAAIATSAGTARLPNEVPIVPTASVPPAAIATSAGTARLPNEVPIVPTASAPASEANSSVGTAVAANKAGAKPAAAASGNSPNTSADSRLIPRSSESVEIAQDRAPSDTAGGTSMNRLTRYDATAIERAKPPMQGAETADSRQISAANSSAYQIQRKSSAKALPFAGIPLRAAAFSITDGALRRSMDGGQTWQNVLSASRPLLCYASHDADVWAGGQGGTLFHSANGGVNWVQLRPMTSGEALTSDITHITLGAPVAAIALLTGTNETWTSADGGATWNKK